jgi:hypothetical protein
LPLFRKIYEELTGAKILVYLTRIKSFERGVFENAELEIFDKRMDYI